LRNRGHNVGCATTGRNETNSGFFCHPRVTERHVPGAALMLRVDEAHLWLPRNGITQRE
jgi:hypothetical protein